MTQETLREQARLFIGQIKIDADNGVIFNASLYEKELGDLLIDAAGLQVTTPEMIKKWPKNPLKKFIQEDFRGSAANIPDHLP